MSSGSLDLGQNFGSGGGGGGGISSIISSDLSINVSNFGGNVDITLPDLISANTYEILGASVDSKGRITNAQERKPTVIAMAIIFG